MYSQFNALPYDSIFGVKFKGLTEEGHGNLYLGLLGQGCMLYINDPWLTNIVSNVKAKM